MLRTISGKKYITQAATIRLLGPAYFQSTESSLIPGIEEEKKLLQEKLQKDFPKPYEGPERDLVNFPKRVRLIEPGKVRMGFLPEEWFQFFYKKTGVTGPYVFGTGLLTYLLSKEWYVIEEEFSTGVAIFMLVYYAIKKFGPAMREFKDNAVKEEIAGYYRKKDEIMKTLDSAIEGEKKYLWHAEVEKTIMEAKRENVQMQLETEYRKRLMMVFEQTKRRLDYHLELYNTKRKLEQKHMVDWIVSSVVKSITPEQAEMGKVYKVQPDWFTKKDKLGCVISTWCKQTSASDVTCMLCNKNIACLSKGFAAITQHCNTEIYKDTVACHRNQMTITIRNKEQQDSPVQSSSTTLNSILQLGNNAVKAELLWTLKSVQCNMAANSCDDLKELFDLMCSGCFPPDFSLGHTKLSYLITEAVGLYFYKTLTDELKDSYFSLLFDETTNKENKKELQISVRFWSENSKKIVSYHLCTFFLGHAKAPDIVRSIRKALSDASLSVNNILMIGSDGPNVNKTVKRIMNEQIIEERGKSLIDIGTCNIHIVHKAFLRGLEKFGEQSSELLINIYHFFKDFPSRLEDYENIQHKLGVPQKKFLKHVPTRWLTIAPAAERVLEQWPAVEEYFLKFVPLKADYLMSTVKYKQIINLLKLKDIKLEIAFVLESSAIFTKFTEQFQKTEPLVHILYDELKITLQTIAGRICKKEKINIKEKIDATMLLAIKDIDSVVVKNSSLADQDKILFLHKVQKHYIAAYNYLFEKTYLYNKSLLPLFKCLQPVEIAKSASVNYIAEISEAMPFTNFDTMLLKDEWRLLQIDLKSISTQNTNSKIDSFWAKIIYIEKEENRLKYPHISKVVKAALCLSHGNSDVERGFSRSGKILTEDKSRMSERMLNARLWICDALHNRYENKVCKVPISKELMNLARNAHTSYKLYLEEQKRIKEEKLKKDMEEKEKIRKEQELRLKLSEKKASIEELEKKTKEFEKQKKEAQKSSDALLTEAKERLSIAISKDDKEGIRVAQGLLFGAEELRKKEREHEQEVQKMNRVVHKRKSSLIETYFKKEDLKKKKI